MPLLHAFSSRAAALAWWVSQRRSNTSCSRYMFVCLGRKSLSLTINQRLQRDSLAFSGPATVGFGWGLCSHFAIFIHQSHLLTADLHGHIAMSEVPQEIFILGDQEEKQRTFFFWNWWVPFSVHQFWTWHSREIEQWLSLSAAFPPLDNPEGTFVCLAARACALSFIHVGDSESSQRILCTIGTNPHVWHNMILNIWQWSRL